MAQRGRLGGVDTAAITFSQGYRIDRLWTDRIGTLALPALWVFISALARGADDSSQSQVAAAALRYARIWLGALRAGATLAVFLWIGFWALDGMGGLLDIHKQPGYLRNQGELLASIVANVLFVQSWVGLCFCPLLVFQPSLSVPEARYLSKRASEINGAVLIVMFTGVIVLAAVSLASVLPLHGMTDAAAIVFLGVLNYVAYRDIFERRSGNVPSRVAATHISVPTQAPSLSAGPRRHTSVLSTEPSNHSHKEPLKDALV